VYGVGDRTTCENVFDDGDVPDGEGEVDGVDFEGVEEVAR